MKGRDALLVGLLGLLTLGAFSTTASASTISAGDETISYNAAFGERNIIDVVSDGNVYLIKDKTLRSIDDMDGEGGCTIIRNVATCPGDLNLAINVGDDHDSVRIRNLSFKGHGINEIKGGSGNDKLRGPSRDKSSFRSVLRFDGGSGYDTIAGGGTADYSSRSEPVTVSLSRRRDDGAPGERDSVTSDSVIGGSAADTLIGSNHSDAIWGGDGSDRLEGKYGENTLDGGEGADTFVGGSDGDRIKARDGIDDASFDCGDGNDTVAADGGDPVAVGGQPGCETVDNSDGGTPSTPDQEAIDTLWNHARRAMDHCALENNGSYLACDEEALIAIDPTLADAAPRVTVTPLLPSSYTITVLSDRAGFHEFSYARSSNGTSNLTCVQPGDGLCAADGTWGPDPDAEATEVLNKAEAAMEVGRVHQAGLSYQQLNEVTLITIDPTLNDAASRLTVMGLGATTYRVSVVSASASPVTYILDRNGSTVTRTCTPAGSGRCSADGSWQGDVQVQARATIVAAHRAMELYYADGSASPHFTYLGASGGLSNYDWTLANAPSPVVSDLSAGSYRVTVTSAGPNPVTYVLTRAANGATSRTCSPSSGYTCHSGSWLSYIHDRADVETMSQANHAHKALNAYAAAHGGSYNGAKLTDLQVNDPSIGGPADLHFYANGTGFSLVADTPSPSRQYVIYRDTAGWVARMCTPAGNGACRVDGSW